jgi:hypothetical protein
MEGKRKEKLRQREITEKARTRRGEKMGRTRAERGRIGKKYSRKESAGSFYEGSEKMNNRNLGDSVADVS